MKLNLREQLVVTGLGLVAMLAVTAWLASAQVADWKNSLQSQKTLRRKVQAAQQLVNQSAAAEQRLQAVQRLLPEYPPDQDVTAEQMAALERLAQAQGLTLVRRDTDREKASGKLRELSIHCTWEAGLEGLIRFLYALQQQGATFDVSQLTVTPAAGALKGTFTVDCSYNRKETEAAGESKADAPPSRKSRKVTP